MISVQFAVRKSSIYYIIKGQGTFYLNDKKVAAQETDLIVIPPKTRIYYFGNMEMLLTVTPAFDEKNERHVRFIDKTESPYTAKYLSNFHKGKSIPTICRLT